MNRPGFRSALSVARSADPNSGTWVLVAPLRYASMLTEVEGEIVVPAGFQTDFASVPRLPFVYWLFGATADEAATVHDWLYSTGEVPRAVADAVFAEASAVCGVPRWRRVGMWLAIRLFGGPHYNSEVVA